jgi:HSP20 family molecular chaperone IbpA
VTEPNQFLEKLKLRKQSNREAFHYFSENKNNKALWFLDSHRQHSTMSLVPLFYHDFFGPLDNWRPSSSSQQSLTTNLKSVLNIDLVETETEFQVHADLPGVEEKDLDISVENNHLVIKGHREKSYESNNATEHRIERSYGSVQRSIRLPPNADQSSCNAHFDNGVLTVTLTKMAPPAASSKIQVNANKKVG